MRVLDDQTACPVATFDDTCQVASKPPRVTLELSGSTAPAKLGVGHGAERVRSTSCPSGANRNAPVPRSSSSVSKAIESPGDGGPASLGRATTKSGPPQVPSAAGGQSVHGSERPFQFNLALDLSERRSDAVSITKASDHISAAPSGATASGGMTNVPLRRTLPV